MILWFIITLSHLRVVEVKSEKHLDLLLTELKESVLGNLNESFFLMRMMSRGIKEVYVFPI